MWREKVEREKQLQELSQQAAVQVEWFKAHMAAAEKRIAELNSLAQSQEIVKHDTGLEELEVLLEKERSKLAGKNCNPLAVLWLGMSLPFPNFFTC